MTMEPKHNQPITAATVQQLQQGLAAGYLTSTGIVEAYLAHIARLNGSINAYISVDGEGALRQAAASDARLAAGKHLSPLDGIPIALKGNIAWHGHGLTSASRMLADFQAPYDATATTRLKEAGMPILGSLNMDEFSMGSTTATSFWGPCHNPWDESRVPGGSSGGSAAAVAAGLAPVALGSDTGGSVRQPASHCGVVGVKPAYGTVSRYGLVAFASSLDQIGVLAKTAYDAALVLDVIAGEDPRDMTTAGDLAAGFAIGCPGPLDMHGLTLAMPRECFGEDISLAVRQSMEDAVVRWQALGAKVIDISLPSLTGGPSLYATLTSAEAYSNMTRYGGMGYGYRATGDHSGAALYAETRNQGLGPEVKRRILLGEQALSGDPSPYQRAQEEQAALCQQLAEAFLGCTALLTPTQPCPAPPLAGEASAAATSHVGDRHTVFANLAGLPALSIPCGLSQEGLPIGMQLTGNRNSLPLLLAMAHQFENAWPGIGQPPGKNPMPEGGAGA